MPGGALAAAGGIGRVAGGIIGSNSAHDAAKAAQSAADQNNALAANIYSKNSANLSPYVGVGMPASNEINGLLGLNGPTGSAGAQSALDTYLGSTNYKFQLGQGEDAIKTAGAASFNSGATAKALNNYAQGQAGSALQGYFGNLQGQQQTGLGAASALAGVGTNYVNQVSGNNNNAAGAAGSADLAGANSWTNALKSLVGSGAQSTTASSYGNGGALSGFGTSTGQSATSAPAAAWEWG